MINMNRRSVRTFTALATASLMTAAGSWAGAALGQERLFIYPSGGQSEAQLADDRFACHERAALESGFDPTRAALAQQPGANAAVVRVPPNRSEGATGKGMVTGAIAGAVVGAAAGEHAGETAAAGAAIGTLIGNAVERKGAEAAEAEARAEGERQLAEAEAEAARAAARRSRYQTVFSACLMERGYTVR